MRHWLAPIAWRLHIFWHRHFCRSCRMYRHYLDWTE